jgi:hypothetical protein
MLGAVSDPARKRPTYDDVLAVPEHLVAEIICGELVTTPRPAPLHTRTASRLGVVLGSAFDHDEDGPGGWWMLDEPELHLENADDPIVPDLAGWRVERMPELPETAYFALPPDWICEVLSRGTAARDRADKMPIYAAAGVGAGGHGVENARAPVRGASASASSSPARTRVACSPRTRARRSRTPARAYARSDRRGTRRLSRIA